MQKVPFSFRKPIFDKALPLTEGATEPLKRKKTFTILTTF